MSDLNFTTPYNPTPPARMSHPVILTGRRFDQLLVIALFGRTRSQKLLWLCRCQCGEFTIRTSGKLFNAKAISCGHLLFGRDTSEFIAYRNAKARCQVPTNEVYDRYGGRGIEFRFTSFEQFFEVIGPKPETADTLERIDNNGHYEAGNVTWTSMLNQSRNRRSNHHILAQGRNLLIAAWSDETNVPRSTICGRLRRGWCNKCAVTNPPRVRCCKFV